MNRDKFSEILYSNIYLKNTNLPEDSCPTPFYDIYFYDEQISKISIPMDMTVNKFKFRIIKTILRINDEGYSNFSLENEIYNKIIIVLRNNKINNIIE